MKRTRSCQESEATWKRLLELSQFNENRNARNASASEDDPFDCRSLAVPPTRTLVKSVLQEYEQKWKALDDRKLVKEPANSDDIEESEAANNNETLSKKKKIRRGGWDFTQGRQLRLPKDFDYKTKLKAPPPISQDKDEHKVIDLLNPTRQLSYHQELWKLFASVPTVEDIKETARSNAQIPRTMQVYNEIVEGTKRVPRLDAHGLSRLRMSDRHGLPPPTTEQERTKPHTSTIRFEFWRRQLKRGSYIFIFLYSCYHCNCNYVVRYPHPIHFHAGSAPDGRRMVLEFLASQTLLDVHNAIVQMTEDDVWTSQKDTTDSGCFFIEDQFYSTGTTDYTGPIIRWIDGGGLPNPTRRGYLGIATTKPFTNVKPMKEATLNHIPFRLGIRYYHVTHGDVECSFSITDSRLVHPATVPYPIIHDIWTPSYPLTLCDACERFAATYVYHHRGSAAKDFQDGEPKALCDNCCGQLKLLEKEKSSLQLYAVWKNKSELSVGMIRDDQCRFF
jgi:hypothetical protein